MHACRSTLEDPTWRYAFLGLVRKSPAHRDPAAIDASAAAWNRHMAILDAALAAHGGPYVTGADFTLADVVLGLVVHRWRSTPIAHASLAAVAAYETRLAAREGYQAHGLNGGP